MPRRRSTKSRFCVTTFVVISEQGADLRDVRAAHARERRRHVVLHAADAHVVRRDARAAQDLHQIPGEFARLDAEQERRHRRQLEAGGAAACQVIAEPRKLAGHRAQPLAALGCLEVEQLLDREAVADVREDRRVVVEAIGVRDRLVPGAAFAFLLEAAVQVADLDVEIDDRLAVEFDQELDGAVRRRVRRPHVEELMLGVQVPVEVALARAGVSHQQNPLVIRSQFLGPTSGWRRSFG